MSWSPIFLVNTNRSGQATGSIAQSAHWAAGDTAETTRNILQHELLGPVGAFGTGLIPKRRARPNYATAECSRRGPRYPRNPPGTAGAAFSSSRASTRAAKASKAHRKMSSGLDEEPTVDIYTECVMRTMTTNGLVMCTFHAAARAERCWS